MSFRFFLAAWLLAGSGVMLAATDDGTAPEAENAPNHDSKYQSGVRLSGAADNTPEADARPGEKYFVEGVRAFQKREFKFAVQMYQVAASWAYKPAEFNLGVIYARGQGVPADLPRALAWMMLAAQRNEQRYVDAREAVHDALKAEQLTQANMIFAELNKTYGDAVALRRARAQWARVRSQMTGSRVGNSGNLSVGMPGGGPGDQSARVASGLSAQVKQGGGITGTTAGDIAGGEAVDGSIAYRQLLESDNPYDAKFDRGAVGTATVGEPVTSDAPKAPAADKDDSAGHEH